MFENIHRESHTQTKLGLEVYPTTAIISTHDYILDYQLRKTIPDQVKGRSSQCHDSMRPWQFVPLSRLDVHTSGYPAELHKRLNTIWHCA